MLIHITLSLKRKEYIQFMLCSIIKIFLIILTFKGSINCKSFQTQSCCVRTPVRDSTYGIKRPLGKPWLYDLREPLHMGMQEGPLGLNPRSKKQPPTFKGSHTQIDYFMLHPFQLWIVFII